MPRRGLACLQKTGLRVLHLRAMLPHHAPPLPAMLPHHMPVVHVPVKMDRGVGGEEPSLPQQPAAAAISRPTLLGMWLPEFLLEFADGVAASLESPEPRGAGGALGALLPPVSSTPVKLADADAVHLLYPLSHLH